MCRHITCTSVRRLRVRTKCTLSGGQKFVFVSLPPKTPKPRKQKFGVRRVPSCTTLVAQPFSSPRV